MKKVLVTITAIAVSVAGLSLAQAQEVPDLIPVQGILTDSVGDTISGNANMQMAVYDSETGGSLIWSELYNSANQIPVEDGFFTVYLGSINSIIWDNWFEYDEWWLGITVGLDEEMDRVRMYSVPFSISSQYCKQIGSMAEEDIQPKLDFECGGDQFLRGWNPDGGPICGVDITSSAADGGTITDVYAGAGLSKELVGGNPSLSVNFGSSSGTVATGDHNHDADYQTILTGGPCLAGEFVANIDPGTGAFTCVSESEGHVYTAGTGLSLAVVGDDEEFAVDTSAIQIKLSGSCGDGEFVSSINPDSGTFSCSPAGAGASYTAGEGIIINVSNEISSNFDVIQRKVYTTATTTDGLCEDGFLIKGIDPDTGLIQCAADSTSSGTGGGISTISTSTPLTGGGSDATIYLGIDVGTTSSSVAAGDHMHDSDYADIADPLAGVTCGADQVLAYNTTSSLWGCTTIEESTDTNADTICSGENVFLDGAGNCTLVATTGFQEDIDSTTCTLGIASIGNDGTIICSSTDDDTVYTGGTGITVSGTIISADISGNGSATTLARSDHNHDSNYADITHAHAWDDVTGKPTEFTPEAHSHPWTQISDKPDKYDDSDLLDGFDSTYFAISTHNHDGDYADPAHDHNTLYYQKGETDTLLAGKSNTDHTHSGYADASHEHSGNDITSGTVSDSYFSAYSDLGAEGYLDNNAASDILTRTQLDGRFAATSHTTDWSTVVNEPGVYPDSDLLDGLDSSAFSFAGHNHDGAYMPWYTSCAGDEILKWDSGGGSWFCSPDEAGNYTEGTGILIAGDSIEVDYGVTQTRLNISGDLDNGTCGSGELVKGIDPVSGAISCAVDNTVGTGDGTVATITGVSPIVTTGTENVDISIDVGPGSSQVAAGDHDHDAEYVNEGQTSSVSSSMITNGSILFEDLSAPFSGIDCEDLCSDANTEYIAGTGIGIAGTTISSTLGTAITTGEITDGTITSSDLSSTITGGACDSICDDADTTYTASTGIVINTSNAISTTLGSSIETGDITNGTITAADLSTTITGGSCDSICDDANTTYAAGTGLSLTGTTFSVNYGTTTGTAAVGNHSHSGYAASTHTHSATDITSGTLSNSRFDAWSNLADNGYLDFDDGDDLLTMDNAYDNFAESGHGHDHGSMTGLSDDDHTQYFNLSQSETVSGRPYLYGGVSGSTPPFYVDSTYKVTSLNADYLDGLDSSAFLSECSDCDSHFDDMFISRNGDSVSTSQLYNFEYTGTTGNEGVAHFINNGTYVYNRYGLEAEALGGARLYGIRAKASVGSADSPYGTTAYIYGIYGDASMSHSSLTGGSVRGGYFSAYMPMAGTQNVYGSYSGAENDDSSSPDHDFYGAYNYAWTSDGDIYGTYSYAGTESGNAHAVYARTSTGGSSPTNGVRVDVDQTGTGITKGLDILVEKSTTGTSSLYGSYMEVNHNGASGYTYGELISVYGSDTNTTYGVFSSARSYGSANAYGGYFNAYEYGTATGNRGIYAYTLSSSGYSGYFGGNVYISGALTKGSGSFVQPHKSDPTKEIVYNFLEGPEHAAFIRGTAVLNNGQAIIDMPEHWLEVAGKDGITVHLTPIGDWAPLYTSSITPERVIIESAPGFATNDVEFSYYIMCKRDMFQGHEPIQENKHFKPDGESAYAFERNFGGDDVTHTAMRRMMISNGTMNQDGTLNQDTAKRLGWNLIPDEEDPIYCEDKDLPCAGRPDKAKRDLAGQERDDRDEEGRLERKAERERRAAANR